VEVHTPYASGAAQAPYATAPTVTLTVYPNGDLTGAGIAIGSGPFSINGAAVSPVTGSNTFSFTSGFNETAGGHALPHSVTKFSYGYLWKGLAAPNVPGAHTVVLAVNGVVKASAVWRINAAPARRLAKNVVLFVGDGMNTGIITASRVLSRGIRHGATKGELHMDGMERLGFLSTNGYDSIITDSANSAAAYTTGHKGPVNALGVYGDTTSSSLDDPKVELITEMIARKYGNANFGIGVVTTSEIQDATPAAAAAHTRRRGDKAEITRQFLEGFDKTGAWSDVPEIDVILGGGGAYFYPRTLLNVTDGSGNQLWCSVSTTPCPVANRSTEFAAGSVPVTSANNGAGLAGRNFYTEAATAGYSVVHDRAAMIAASAKNKKLLGIFHSGNLDVWLDRHEKTQNIVADGQPRFIPTYAGYAARTAPMDQPDLSEMTDAAIKVLERRSKDGFFLVVEGASIDKAEHPYDNERAIDELIDMDNAVGVALRYARAHQDTLVLVTADHGHAFDVFGTVDLKIFDSADALSTNPEDKKRIRASATGFYNKAGFPDVVDVDGDGFPDNFATARYTLGVGYADIVNEKESYRLHDSMRNPSLGAASGDYQKAITGADDGNLGGNNHGAGFTRNTGGSSGVHTMQDVPLYAEGPGAELVRSSMVNVDVFTLMATALGLGGSSASNPANAPAS
jgi:alkaline phosphatase